MADDAGVRAHDSTFAKGRQSFGDGARLPAVEGSPAMGSVPANLKHPMRPHQAGLVMTDPIRIDPATETDAPLIAPLVGELLAEIMQAIGVRAFNFDLPDTVSRLAAFLREGTYFAFLARDATGGAAGFLTLCEARALYAAGVFGTIPELYVRPELRSAGIGGRLVSEAGAFGIARGWTRLEVTTPPLPQFQKTLAFYEREGFGVTGGRKLKILL